MRIKSIRLILAAPLLLALATACTTRIYDDCAPDHKFGAWGIINHSDLFGADDSIYFLVNPIDNVNDSIYFNGNYTDTYFRADSTRYTLAYGPGDSLRLYIQRMYAVEVNPPQLVAEVRVIGDTVKTPRCTLNLTRVGSAEEMYVIQPDTTFLSLLKLGKPMAFRAWNGPGSSASEGSQFYTWTLYTTGFADALRFRDILNGDTVAPAKKDSLLSGKKDSLDKKDSRKEHRKEHRHLKL